MDGTGVWRARGGSVRRSPRATCGRAEAGGKQEDTRAASRRDHRWEQRVARGTDIRRGATWSAVSEAPASAGAVYGAAWVAGAAVPAVVAAGPGGLDVSTDGGRTWRVLDPRPWWAVAFAAPDAGWAVGPEGRVARLRLVAR